MERASIKFVAFFFVILAFASTFTQVAESSTVPSDGAGKKPALKCPEVIVPCSGDKCCKEVGCEYCAKPDEHADFNHCH